MNPETLQRQLAEKGYIADRPLATTLCLFMELQRPLLLEGDAGVGKTEIAKTLAAVTARPLVRLQCYEGLDVSTAVYEWDYRRQLLSIQLASQRHHNIYYGSERHNNNNLENHTSAEQHNNSLVNHNSAEQHNDSLESHNSAEQHNDSLESHNSPESQPSSDNRRGSSFESGRIGHNSHARSGPIDESELFSETFLLRRPLLRAISSPEPVVLLIDEVDRADEEFEAYLLELLSDFQVSIPEIGTLRAISRPQVILTSNATRELSDALRRRCFYHYVDYPDFDREMRIVAARLPRAGPNLARQVIAFVHSLREMDLRKRPGIAETLDWTAALLCLGIDTLAVDDHRLEQAIRDSLVCLLKTREDRDALPEAEFTRKLRQAR